MYRTLEYQSAAPCTHVCKADHRHSMKTMRLAGLLILAAGLLCVVGSIGYTVYSMATAFTTVQADGQAAATGMSLGTALSITSVGLVMIIAGIILLAAANRS